MEAASIDLRRTENTCPFIRSVENLKLGKAWYELEVGKLSMMGDVDMDVTVSGEAAALWNQLDSWNEDLWGGFTTG